MNRFLPIAAIALITLGVFGVSFASSINTDRGQKNHRTHKSTILETKFKSYYPLSFNSGYRLKGTLHFTTTNQHSMVIHHNVMRFEKGNTIYVLPYRQKQAHARIKFGVHP